MLCKTKYVFIHFIHNTLATLKPVSYTHLDVYKRQLPTTFDIIIGNISFDLILYNVTILQLFTACPEKKLSLCIEKHFWVFVNVKLLVNRMTVEFYINI